MKVGVCTPYANAEKILDQVDFVEEVVGRLLVGEADDAAFAAASAGATKCGLPIPAVNRFVPGHLKSTGPNVDMDALLAYVKVVMSRAQQLGITTIAYGSGGSRKLDDGVVPAEAMDQFAGIVRDMAPIAQAHGITIVIEPLHNAECNFINSLQEGAEIVVKADHPNVKLLADFYHMLRDGEDPEEIVRFGDMIRHVHLAEEAERTAPGVAGDDFRPFLTALKEIGYDSGISIESKWGDDFPGELAKAIVELKTQMSDVGMAV